MNISCQQCQSKVFCRCHNCQLYLCLKCDTTHNSKLSGEEPHNRIRICEECELQVCVSWCMNCEQYLCSPCNVTLHRKGARQNHKRKYDDLFLPHQVVHSPQKGSKPELIDDLAVSHLREEKTHYSEGSETAAKAIYN